MPNNTNCKSNTGHGRNKHPIVELIGSIEMLGSHAQQYKPQKQHRARKKQYPIVELIGNIEMLGMAAQSTDYQLLGE